MKLQLKRGGKITLLALGLVILVSTAIAAVPGFFSAVDSTNGYTVAGAAGSSGQALCSDGSHFNTPCTPSGTGITALTGPVTASGTGSVAATITPTGVTAAAYSFGSSFTVNAAGQMTSAANLTFTGASGYQLLPSGLILEWGSTGSIVNDTATAVTFPLTFPNAVFNVTCSDTFAGSQSAVWSCYSPTVSGFTGRPDGNTATGRYFAIGD